jgi:predicted transcriptional regulator
VGRILGDFDDRHWVRRDGERYELTRLGGFVAEEFDRFHESMTTARDLQDLLHLIPLDEMGIGVANLSGARVTTNEAPLGISTRIREIELGATHARTFTTVFPEPCVDARCQAVLEGTQTYEAVFTATALDTAVQTVPLQKFEALVASERTMMYRCEEDMPLTAFLSDGVVCLIIQNDQRSTVGLVETDDEKVVAFAEATFETYREQSTPFTTEELRKWYERVTEAR